MIACAKAANQSHFIVSLRKELKWKCAKSKIQSNHVKY